MPSRPIPVDDLVTDLRRVEQWLTNSLGMSVDGDDREVPDPFAVPDDLDNLKTAIDRIRPLLWVYLTRQNESRAVQRKKPSAGVRSLVEDAMAISDRYVRKGD